MKFIVIAACVSVIVLISIFQNKRKKTSRKITISDVIAIVAGVLIVVGFRYLLNILFPARSN
jgi:hypothetical protein